MSHLHVRASAPVLVVFTALALSAVLAPAASADVRLLPVNGATLTSAGATVTVDGFAIAATCRVIPNEPCQPITMPGEPCRNLPTTPGDPCRVLNFALSALGRVQPGQACTPIDPCRVITAFAAAVVTPTARCAAVGVQSTIRTTGDVFLNTTSPVRFNPFTPTDPCRVLGSVPVGYRIPMNADGSIGDAIARPGPISVDLPPILR